MPLELRETPLTGESPFLKWPGGKRWACSSIVPIIRKYLRRIYYEPFLGGGAVYFALRPPEAVLSDINAEVVNVYRQVRRHHRALIRALQQLPVTSQTYNQIRTCGDLGDPFNRAVRFLYLNRTAFAGIYRVNKEGQFNVPFGGGQRTPAILWKRGILEAAARALRPAKIRRLDFESVLTSVGKGDVIYCDPIYTVAHNNNGFRRYNECHFTWEDQQRLAILSNDAAEKGATVLVSNAYHHEVRALYKGHQEHVLARSSAVARNPAFRHIVQESLFVVRKR